MTTLPPDIDRNGHDPDMECAPEERLSNAWEDLADALIGEVRDMVIVIVEDATTQARGRLTRALADAPARSATVTDALFLGAAIGIIGTALLASRPHHGQ